MATQGRNELCGCGRGKKYKKCCGRFTLQDMTAKLAAFAAANKQKNKLVERSLKFLQLCEKGGGVALLILVDPVVKDDIVSWTNIGGRGVGRDVREAVVTRRVLAGYLPMCCLVEDKSEPTGWHAVVDETLVAEEWRDEYIAFALEEAKMVANTLNGNLAKEDSWMTPTPWEDLNYPGMPLKPRPAGTIRIEVNIPSRTITTMWGRIGSMTFAFPEEDLTGNDARDVVYEARHVIEALKTTDPPKRLVDGDKVEIWQVVPDGGKRLLASLNVRASHPLTRSEFDVLGGDDAN